MLCGFSVRPVWQPLVCCSQKQDSLPALLAFAVCKDNRSSHNSVAILSHGRQAPFYNHTGLLTAPTKKLLPPIYGRKPFILKETKCPLAPRSFDAHVVYNRVREQGGDTEFSKAWHSRQVAKENTKWAPSTFWRTKGRTLPTGILFLKPDEKIGKDLAVVSCLKWSSFQFLFWVPAFSWKAQSCQLLRK